MAAMSVRVRGRGAVLLARSAQYPPWIAFYLAHELGHLALGHVREEGAVVDMRSSEDEHINNTDAEERDADRFALQLLTGYPEPRVLPATSAYNAPGLAHAVVDAGRQLRIEPGALALSFGFSTRQWAVVNSAMKHIYPAKRPVWQEVNQTAATELNIERIPDDSRSYIAAVLGAGDR
jgi:IrrE N-terminal-like domain